MTKLNVLRMVGVILFSAFITFSFVGCGSGGSNDHNDTASDRIADLESQGTRVAIHKQTGMVSFIGNDSHTPNQSASAVKGLDTDDAAMALVKDYSLLFGLRDPAGELGPMKKSTGDDGRSMVRYQQNYQGVPVIAGELIVNMDKGNNLLSMGGEISHSLQLSIIPKLSSEDALGIALDAVAKWYNMDTADLEAAPPELWIYDSRLLEPGIMPANLVWRMEVISRGGDPVREFVLVDAHTGNISLHFTEIETAKNRLTYDSHNTNAFPGTQVCTESSNNNACTGGTIPDADYAHLYAGDTYDFYLTYHGRDSINGAGMNIISTVRYCVTGYPCPLSNAAWTGTQMIYGQGFSQADDVVGHELTHGVTQYTSKLLYYYQSGAINESLSDIWGEYIDQTNGKGTDTPSVKWRCGEDIASGAIRDMKNPTLYGDPDRMKSVYYYTGNLDSGGVHTNSGVNNKAAYLMTDGDTFNGKTVTGLGITKVAKIYYEAQTHLLTSGSNYYDLYQYLYQACLNLVGTSGISAGDCQQVRNATDAVEMDKEPVVGFEPIVTPCPAGQIQNDLFFDDMENSTNWTFSNLVGANSWVFINQYASSGVTSIWANDITTASNSVASMKADVMLPPGAFLHFHHAFGFEACCDGGVVEYSINGGGTWTDAGSLFNAGKNYGGSVSSFSGRSAFKNDSHGYVTSKYDLNSLAGNNVRFRFREANDYSVAGPLGWVVDDVRIYTCVTGSAHPVPTITTISPSSATAGDAQFTLTVNGTNFVNGVSTIRWNGSDRTTSFVSSSQLTAEISAADIAAGGTVSVTVFNSSPGGGSSGALIFTVIEPNHAPSKPNLTSPANGSTGMPMILTLKWDKCSDPDGNMVSYKLYIGTDQNFTGVTPIVVASISNKYRYALASLYSTGIISLLGMMVIGGFSRNRRKIGAYIIVVLIAGGLILSSCGSGGGSGGGSDSGGGGGGSEESTVPDVTVPPPDNSVSYTISNLQTGTTYYWKVVSDDGNGGLTDSDTFNFTTVP